MAAVINRAFRNNFIISLPIFIDTQRISCVYAWSLSYLFLLLSRLLKFIKTNIYDVLNQPVREREREREREKER